MSTINQRMAANDIINGNGYGVDGNKNNPLDPKPQSVVFTSASEAAQLPGMLGIIASKDLRSHGWYSAKVGGVHTLYVA